MANAVVNRQVNVYINSGEAAKAYDVLIKREKLLNAELAKTTDPKRIKQLTAELDKLKDPIDRAAKKMKGELAPSIRELELATRKFLNEFKKTGDPETLRKFQAFQAELNKAKLQLTDLGTANKGLTSGGIFKSAFWANLAAGGIAQFTSFISGAVSESTELAKAGEGIRNRFAQLNNPALLNKLRQATRGTISDLELMKAAVRADNFKIPLERLGTLLQFASQRARETGDSVEYLAESIILGISRKSIPIMDNLGISATELQKRFKETGDFGKAAFQIVNEELAKAGPYIETAADEADRLKAEFANTKEEIGRGLLPLLIKIGNLTSGFVQNLKSFGNALRAEISGNSGYIQIALDEIRDNPELQNAITETADQTVSAVMSAQKQIEAQLGRKLNLKSKEDAELLKKNQDLRIQGFKDAIARDEQALQNLIKEGKRQDQQEARSLKIAIVGRTQAIQQLLNPVTSSGKSSSTTEEDADKLKEINKALEERKKLIEELNKIKFDQSLYDLPAFDKELKLVDQKYAKFRERAKGDKELLIRIEQLYLTEKLQLIDTYTDREVDIWLKATQKSMDEQDKIFVKQLQRLRDRAKEMLNEANDGSVKAQNALTLQNQQDDEDALKNEILKYIGYAQQINSILSQISQSKTEQENAELERDRQLNDKKIRNLDNRLKKGIISQQQYDSEVQEIEKNQEKREKQIRIAQFERQKRQNIVQAIMNTAEGVTEAYPNLLLAGIIASAGIAQVALIASQKAPEFAHGGKLGGRSHSAGGNAVIDGSGRKIAEVEAGEGIVNKRTMADGRRYSVSGTPNQIISRLNGMYGSSWEAGATLIPGWRSYSPQRMNYSAMKRMYADGGVMGSNSGNQGADNSVFENLTAMISDMQSTQAYLASVLANGIVADVSLNRFEQQQERLTAIRRDATLRG